MKSNNPDATTMKGRKVPGEGGPDMGAQMSAGKSNMEDAVLRTGMQPKSEAVRNATEDTGSAKRARDKQVGNDGNPKSRTRSYWGTESKHED